MYEIILIIFLSEGNKKQESACSASGNCLAHLVTIRENNVRRKRRNNEIVLKEEGSGGSMVHRLTNYKGLAFVERGFS